MVITRDNLSIVLKLIVLICQLTVDMMSLLTICVANMGLVLLCRRGLYIYALELCYL